MENQKFCGIDSVLYSMRKLFSGYGYSEYKMNKFEEYDLYVKNKDFLISDNVITFTDTNGKLLALKPDVTLSIVKNTKLEGGVKKVFYGENVYRVSSKSNGYKEIQQMGLECIGEIDEYNVAEVITLAIESLKKVSQNSVLDISPVGIISGIVENLGVNNLAKTAIYKCVNEKNTHELVKILAENGVNDKEINTLTTLIEIYGDTKTAIASLKALLKDSKCYEMVLAFENILSVLSEDVKNIIRIDCSSCENVKYYNDITFKGYIDGAPKAVLSGGRYDGLLKIMGKDCGAIGFAIYPDEFDRLFAVKKEYDVDVVIIYDDKTDKTAVLTKVQQLVSEGKQVTALKSLPARLTYKEIIEI